MITFKQGDLFQDRAQALVNPVNCVGVMGKGIALQFKEKFPDNFKEYAQACRWNRVRPGRMFVFDTYRPQAHQYIINFPTKRHWRDSSRIEDIEAGTIALAGEIRDRRIESIAIPALGSGLGGLDWNRIRAILESGLRGLEGVRITIYEPISGGPAGKPRRSSEARPSGEARRSSEARPSGEARRYGETRPSGEARQYDETRPHDEARQRSRRGRQAR